MDRKPDMLQSMGLQSWTWLSDWTELNTLLWHAKKLNTHVSSLWSSVLPMEEEIKRRIKKKSVLLPNLGFSESAWNDPRPSELLLFLAFTLRGRPSLLSSTLSPSPLPPLSQISTAKHYKLDVLQVPPRAWGRQRLIEIEIINKNLINFLYWLPASPLKLQNLELKKYTSEQQWEEATRK